VTSTALPLRRLRPSAVVDVTITHAPLVAWATIAVAVRLVFWTVTDRTWEDALIAISHARNAAEGLGLTNHPGEGLVHGFTSALSVLIPLLGELLHSGWGLAAIRIASLLAAAAAVAYGYAIARRLGLGPWPMSFALGYLALNYNQMFYGIGGKETQVAAAVVLAVTYHVLAGQHIRTGIALGLAMLARPDLVILAALVMALAARGGLAEAFRTGAAAASLVVPWLVFTTLYYGSPVPHSIPALALWSPLPALAGPPGEVVALVGERVTNGLATAVRAFTPFYEDSFVVSAPLPIGILVACGATMLVLAGIGAWSTRHLPRWWPAVGFVALFTVYRAFLLPTSYFDWYIPPYTALCALLIAAALQGLVRRAPIVSNVLAAVLLLAAAVHLPFTMVLESRIQREIEDGIRRPVGIYLRDAMAPGEEFISESVGYFGYYSGHTIWDQAGLTSPTAYAAARALPPEDRRVEGLVDALRPDWAVLRPMEWARLQRDFPEAAGCYSATRSFGQDGRDRIGWGGLEKVTFDWSYTVYRRDGCVQAAP
jgi:hypothetical protein